MGSMFHKPNGDESHSPTSFDTSHNDMVDTVVGPSVHVEGDFVSEGNMVVKGSVKGSVKTSQLLTVEGGAKIVADVQAGEASVSGTVEGNIHTEDRLELTQSAQVLGDISCGTLIVAPGAVLHGTVSMHDARQSMPAQNRSTKKAPEEEEEVEAEA